MPGYKAARNEIRDKGIDEVLIYCVNDAAVMEAWAKDRHLGLGRFFQKEDRMVENCLGRLTICHLSRVRLRELQPIEM